ncbi:hypothetical protein CMV_005071 [Castanea mollissima]|uniref:Uncharacterized protein n=1 Tax=Castanea mollissima TaxID=60419 RepID=A0A8J4RTC8_9ROSI|nr:hypothetical protein CMV_005071 [Castanea mollissima]
MTSNFQSKSFENLKSIKLSESPKLIEAPGIIEVPNLKSMDLIRELYSLEVAVQILAIPISSCGVTDKLLWPHTTQLSMHKPMMHNMLIRVTTGESQGKCVQSWRDGKCC